MNKVFIGMDIGGTKLIVAATDSHGHILKRERAATPLNYDEGIALIHELIAKVSDGAEIAAIGAGAGGPLDWRTGVVSPLNQPEWRDVPLKALMEEHYGCPFSVDVDTNLAALAEYHHSAEKAPRFCYVTVSTGVGGGFVVDGEIYRGMNGQHPEVGHQSLSYRLAEERTVACPCGSNGCLEALVSGGGIRRLYRKPPEDLSSQEWEEVAWNLGQGLRNIAAIYTPDVIVVGGGVTFGARDAMLAPAIQVMRDHLKIVPHPRVLASEMGEHNVLGGAILLALRAEDSTLAQVKSL
jgi:predicted NBD/HSP70 family sugar kinase